MESILNAGWEEDLREERAFDIIHYYYIARCLGISSVTLLYITIIPYLEDD